MKYIISLFALILALPATAQVYGKITPSPLTTNIVAGDTLTLNTTIDCRKQKYVAVNLAFQLDAAGDDSTNCVLTFTKSLDNVNFPTRTADEFTWTIALNGTNMVYATTNFYAGGIGYLRLKTIELKESAANMTNVVFSYATKTSAN